MSENIDNRDFEHGTVKYKNTVGNRRLNQGRQSFIHRAAALAAGAGLILTSSFWAKKIYDANQDPSWFEQPIDEYAQMVNLHSILNDQKQTIPPAFQEDAKMQSGELARDQLIKRGINPDSKNIFVREVKGGTYPSSLEAGQMQDEKGEYYGIWGEVMLDNKPTGVYLSKNFYDPQEQKSISK